MHERNLRVRVLSYSDDAPASADMDNYNELVKLTNADNRDMFV